MSVSTALAARLECLSEQVEKLLAHVETDVLSGNQEATLSPTPADGPKSTVGIMLSDLTIHNMVVGGPAFNSRLINIGDRIVAVDGQKVGLDNFEAALVGSDLPGSEVVLTVFRESEKIEKQVTLRRMARSAMSDLVTMFEQFTRLEGLAADFDDPELSQCLEEAVRQWTKLQIASSSQERSTARRVNQMQSDCRALTLDLRKQIQELHHEWLEDLRPRAAEPETPGLGPAFRPSSWTPGAPTVVVTSLSATGNTDSAMPPSLSTAPPFAKDESVEVQKASVQELTAECLSICDDLRRSMAADVMAPIPIKRQHRNIEEVQCGSADGELTTTGIVFNGLVVQNMIVGSPAYTCAELDKGDEIRSVDGVSVTPSTLAKAMIGPDLIGSEVTLTVMKKKTQAKREITLVRMARETLADYVHMFSLFTAVKEYALLSADEEGAACVDKCISHWTNMLLSSASEEQMTRIHVKRLQQSGVQCICKLQQRLDDVMKAFLTDLQGQERERKVEIQQFEERLAEREGEARALLSKNEVIVAEASKQQEARRQHLLSMIVKRMLKAVLSAGFARWRQNLRDQKILMTKTSRALRRWRNRAFASVFGRWAWYADERSRVRVQMSRILLRLSNRAASLAFEMWMNGVRIASQERAPPPPLPPPPRLLQELELEKEAKEVLKTKLLANEAAFRETEEKLVASQDRRLAQARRVVQRLLHSQLAGAFDSFHSRVVETQSKRQLCQRAVSRMQHLCLEDAWQMFTATVQQLKTHRGMVARAVSRWKLPGARIAFDAWLEYVAEQQFEAMATSARDMSQQLKSAKALEMNVAEGEDARRALEVQLVAKNQQLQDLEGRLTTSVQSATELEEKIVQLQGELSEMRYTSSKTESESGKRVSHLQQVLVQSQDRRLAQARRVVQRLLHSQLAGAFDSFHSRVVETQSKRQLCQRAVSRMQHLCLEDAWQMFTATVQQLKTHRGMVARAVSRWKLPGARIAFDAWLQYMLHVELNEAQSAVEKSEQKIRDETAILKQECEQSTTMIAKAAAELTSTQEKVAELETALSEKEALLKSRTTELSHTRELLDDCTMLMKKNEESEAMLKLEGHKVEQRLWAALSALEKELMEKNETLLSLKAKEEQVQRQLIEERARTLETETLLQARDDRTGRLEATLAEMEVQKTECAKYTRQLEQQAEIAAASIINLSHDIDRTKEEVALKIFHLRGDLEGRVTRERNQLCAMLEVAWAEVNTLKRERDGLQQELAAGTQWADDLDSQVEVLRFELTCKTDTLKTHEEEAQRMAACLAEKEEAVHDSVDRLKAFKAEAATGLQQAEERRKIQLMSLSVRRLLRVAARKAFLHWCQHIQELATTAAKSQTVLARWKNRSGAKCFDAWHDHSMGETQKRKVMAKVVKRLQVRGILNAFTAWDMVVVEAIANRESEKQHHASMTTSKKLRALEPRAEQLQSSLVERDASIEGLRNRVQELKAELSEVISGAVNLKMASEAHIIHLEQQSQLAASSVSSLKDDMEQMKRELSQKLGRIKSELETRVVNERSQLLLLLEQAWSQLQDQKSDADLLEAKVTEKELRVVGLEGRVEALTGVLSDVRESAERARVESQDSVALLERELAQEKGQVKASALELKTLADCLRRLQEQKAGWKDMLWRCRQLSSTLHARLAKSPLEAPNTLSHDLLTSLPGNSSLPSSTSTTTVGVMFDAQGVVESILPGGPAHTSRKIEKGDQIIQVDGVEVSGEDLLHAITGSDLPSSVVTLTVRKKATSHIQGEFVQAGEIVNVSLQRLSTARVAMRRRVFDNFTMLHGKAKQDSDTEARVCIQETLELWEKMLVTQHDQDAQFELNVRALQEECCGWTQELSSLLAGIDAMQGWHEGDSASAHVLPTFGNELRFARETEVEEQEEGEDTPRARSINSSADSPFQAGRHFTLFSSRTPHQ